MVKSQALGNGTSRGTQGRCVSQPSSSPSHSELWGEQGAHGQHSTACSSELRFARRRVAMTAKKNQTLQDGSAKVSVGRGRGKGRA